MAEKTREVKELTIRGLEPEIQRLVAKQKAEVRRIETRQQEELRRQVGRAPRGRSCAYDGDANDDDDCSRDVQHENSQLRNRFYSYYFLFCRKLWRLILRSVWPSVYCRG